MEDRNRLNSDTVVMLRTDPYEIRLMQNPYDAAVKQIIRLSVSTKVRKIKQFLRQGKG